MIFERLLEAISEKYKPSKRLFELKTVVDGRHYFDNARRSEFSKQCKHYIPEKIDG